MDREEEKNKTENPSNEDEDLETNKVPLIGNYLRIIMQETDGNIVENGYNFEIFDWMNLCRKTILNIVDTEFSPCYNYKK